MRVALREAAHGLGRTAPNPAVGCVIAKNDKLLAKGFHHRAGLPHAEVEALAIAGDTARGATAYVTLEPCNHTGRTGPCTEALIAAGVTRVVAALRDPHAIVDGKGIERLRAAGVLVDVGCCEQEARELVGGFILRVTTGRPRVTLKAAVSLDGRLATRNGDARWVTGEAARRDVHVLRDHCDAILVGAGTVHADDPELTTRVGDRVREPDLLRVVLDGHLSISPDAHISRPGTLLFAGDRSDEKRSTALLAKGVEIVRLPSDVQARIDIVNVLDELGRRGVNDLLVEGGGAVHGQLVAAGLADRVVLYIAPKLVGAGGVPLLAVAGPAKMADAWTLTNVIVKRLDDDVRVSGELVKRKKKG